MDAHETQQQNLSRVTERIAGSIQGFFSARLEPIGNRQFHAMDLVDWVVKEVGRAVSPESPSRVMRSMKANGLIDYELVSRAESLYRAKSQPVVSP